MYAQRSGESVKLKDLLDEAVKIAEADISERSKVSKEVVAHIIHISYTHYTHSPRSPAF